MEITTDIPQRLLVDDFTGEVGQAERIAYPTTTEDVQEVLKKADEQGKKVITVGARTGVVSGTLARQNEVLLSLEKMNQIIALDEETLTLTVEAGVTISDIRDYLAGTPYFYAPDPGAKNATVGGNAATNAGGMRAVKYGVTRDNIRSMEVVLASGEVIQAGSLNMKSSSGYDLKNLFIGSEGTLGVITKLQLRLLPKTAYERSLIVGFDTLQDLAPVIYKILSQSIKPTALEFFERKGMEQAERFTGIPRPETKGNWYILLTLDGDSLEIMAEEVNSMADLAVANGAIDSLVLTAEEATDMWLLRDSLILAIKEDSQIEPYDIVVPVNKITETILGISEISRDMNLQDAFFGHAGDGNIHANLLRGDLNDAEWETARTAYNDRVYQLVVDNGVLPSAEHGIGLMKKKYLQLAFSEAELALMKQIKRAVDPKNILNPGKVFDL